VRQGVRVPYGELETLFLDVGNTLVSMDLGLVARGLEGRGYRCTRAVLERAEARARPQVSRFVVERRSTETREAFARYLALIVAGALECSLDAATELAGALAPELRRVGKPGLWSAVLPGVPGALEELRALGLSLVAVSNSDGTVESVLEHAGLRASLGPVVDSHRVGFEKPDPRIFHIALERSGARPETTLHVGDLYHVDVVGARAAGLRAVLLDPHGLYSDQDCVRVPSLAALADAVEAGAL